ncbi:MAG: PAS domain S-box protein, partial [Methylococcus sp.]
MADSPRPDLRSGGTLSSLRGGMMLLLTLLTLAGLGGLGYGLHILHDHAGLRARDRLTTLAEQQRQLIERVLQSNREDIQLFASGDATLARQIPALANANPPDPALKEQIAKRLGEIAKLHHYSTIAVFGPTGEPLLVLGQDAVDEHAELARQVIAEGAARFVDLHAQPEGDLEYGVMSPVGPEHQPARAALYFAQNPEETLFPLIKAWPIASRTGETLLVRRESEHLHPISPVRFANAPSLTPTEPAPPLKLADHPAATDRSVFREEALDYRGEPVMVYLTPIAGAPWHLLVLQNRKDIHQDALLMTRIAIFLAFVIIALVYFLAHLVVRRLEHHQMKVELRNRRQLEERLDNITSTLGTVFWEADPATGAITFLSDSVAAVTGYPRQSWTTFEDLIQRILPEDREGFRSAIEHLQPDQASKAEYRLNTADNRIIWVEDRFRLDMDTLGNSIIRGMARDISAQKQVETHLLESEQRFSEVVERIPVGIFTLHYHTRDVTLRFEYLSDRMCSIIGVDKATAMENAHAAFNECLPEDLTRLQAANWESAMTGQPFQFEGRFRVRDEIRWLRLNSTPMFLPNGDSLWNGVVIDVTDSKRSELALQQLQQELTLILDGLPAQIWYKDTENRMLRVNAQVAKALGRPKSEIEGRDTRDYYPEQADRYYQDDLAVLESGVPRLGIIEPMTLPNGERHWISTDKMPLIGEDGHTQRILVTSTDVTELHHATEALQQEIETRTEREREVQRLNQQFAALSQINQTLLRGQTREQIFQDICRIQVETGQVAMAWVGRIDAETRRVVPMAAFGDESGYLDKITIYADDRPEGQGPTGTALREDRPIIIPDFFQDPSTLPWRAAAQAAGWVCSASLPIHGGGKVLGAFTLYGRQPDAFTPEAVALLKQSAANISYALDLFAREERRQQAEQQVARAAERYACILASAQDAFWVVDARTGRLLDVNDTAVAMLGYPREELLRLRVSDLDPNFDPAAYAARVAQITETRGALFETRQRTRDGHLIDVEVSTVPDRGSMTMIAFIRDISQRKADEAKILDLNASLERRVEERTGELKESEERFRLAMAATKDGLWDWDLPTGRTSYSPGYARMLGYEPEELPPHADTWLDLLHPEDRDSTLARQQSLLTHRGHFEMEFRLRAKDGHYIWILSRGKTVARDGAGNPVRAVGTHVDLTERKTAEILLRDSEGRYRQLSDTLERQVQERTRQLTAALAAKSQFLANMSHEIRTPMNAVLGLAQLLEREPLTPGQAAQVRHIREAGDALLLIINDILDLSKIEAGQFTLEQTGFKLTTVLERLENLFRLTALEKGLQFTVRREGDLPEELLGDALRLGQVLTNLCGNA